MILSDKKNCQISYCANNEIGSKSEVLSGNNFRLSPKLSARATGKKVLWEIKKVLQSHFPDLAERLNRITDTRERRPYSPSELVFGGLVLFLLKCRSRNAMNNRLMEKEFSGNYRKLFKMPCPGMDAVEDFYRELPPEEFDDLKTGIIAALIEKRSLHNFRLLGKYFTIAVDATGAYSSQTKHWEECTSKTSKNGVVTLMNHVPEAKLACSNGLSLSLCSEWIINTEGEYDKQDCEITAFKRLSVRLKKYFPRLPVCLVFDGLYCNAPVMDICRTNNWQWIAVFKDGNLPSVHQELDLLPAGAFRTLKRLMPQKKTSTEYYRCNDLDYRKYQVHWIKCLQETTTQTGIVEKHHFEYLTSISQDCGVIEECVEAARDRWHIEDSFNDQKNREFNMQHLFSRSSFTAFCNWYQTMQLARIIYQFAVRTKEFTQLLNSHSKQTIRHLWENMCSVISMIDLQDFTDLFDQWIATPRQVRLS